jgi:3-oxoacyl-[acyl-carrier protein] reductase
MSKLLGKRALVTAGAQGIGFAISSHLLRAGCDVFVHYRSSADGARDLAAEAAILGRRFASASADLTTSEASNALVTQAVTFLGGLDVLINNAGSLIGRRTLLEADDRFWSDVISLNVGSVRRVTRAAAPHLIAAAQTGGGASIVNLSSLAGRKGGHGGSLAYSTAKGAVLTFTRSLASELGPQGVRVNALAPGLILGTSFHTTHTTAEAVRATVAGIPLGRGGSVDDVANAVCFLAGDEAGYINGHDLVVDGGWRAK